MVLIDWLSTRGGAVSGGESGIRATTTLTLPPLESHDTDEKPLNVTDALPVYPFSECKSRRLLIQYLRAIESVPFCSTTRDCRAVLVSSVPSPIRPKGRELGGNRLPYPALAPRGMRG